MVDKRADAAAAYAKAPKPPQPDAPASPDAPEDAAAPAAASGAGAGAGERQPGQQRKRATLGQEQAATAQQQAESAQAEPSAPAAAADDADEGSLLVADLDELAAKAQMADEYLVLAQRTQADFENYRKRAARESALAQERGAARLAKELLPAIDNLDRAIQAAEETEPPDAPTADAPRILDGVKLVRADLLAALQRAGIEPFSPAGEQFNPQFHEAVAQNQVEGVAAGIVVEVYQQGYRQGDTVLRPARVLVAA